MFPIRGEGAKKYTVRTINRESAGPVNQSHRSNGTHNMIEVAAHFLNHLESDEDIQLRHVMRRICSLLGQRLADEKKEDNATSETSLIDTATRFLDYLESGEKVQLPHVMNRIQHLLAQRLATVEGKSTLRISSETTGEVPKTVEAPENNTFWTDDVSEVTDDRLPGHAWREEEVLGGATDDETIIQKFNAAVHVLERTDGPLYVDVLFLRTADGGYVIKEFCAECREGPVAWITVKSPSDTVQSTEENDYAANHIHGLNWDSGVMEPEELHSSTVGLFSGGRQVYVRGASKIDAVTATLAVIRRNVTDLVKLPKLQTLRRHVHLTEECPYHRNKWWFACAKKHARALAEKSWRKENL